MLDELIAEGRLLHQRIAKHYEPGPASLPPEERITVPELEAWYKGVSQVLDQHFGVESDEARLWRDGLERIRTESTLQIPQVRRPAATIAISAAIWYTSVVCLRGVSRSRRSNCDPSEP